MIGTILKDSKHLHFIGVGGSGIFPIVQIMLAKGYKVSGSDNNEGDTVELEKSLGVEVFMGHSADNIKGADMVVYSAAIPSTNPELVAARAEGIPCFERSEILGYITQQYSNCICISGTHGKTSATAMLTQILVESGLDPTAVIGGKLPLIGGNGRLGKSDIMTCESCEYMDTFLHLSPDISVILNVDEDHLEYFKNLDNIKKSFNKFARLTTKLLVVNGDDPNTMDSVKDITCKTITFGFNESNDYFAKNIKKAGPATAHFDVYNGTKKITTLTLNVPGRHHILNALAATICALEVGASPHDIATNLPHYKGAGRRFEMLGVVNGVQIADDYAHHPKEIAATLEAAKSMGYNKVWAVFQPFTYSRTSILLDDFAESLKTADHVVMSEIMGARETNTYNIYTKDLAAKIPNSVWFQKFSEISDYVMKNAKEGDLVLTIGCGDIYKCAKLMLKYHGRFINFPKT